MKLYFPTSSLNFNDMFATESISPKIFYSKRSYGTKRCFGTELSPNDNYLTLFTKMPLFQLAQKSTSEYEEFPIIIEISYDPSYFSLFKISDDIYATDSTIYFTPDKIKLYFFSETHVKLVLAKSKLVEETKLVFRYRENFRLINNENLTKMNLYEINYPKPDEVSISQQLQNDSTFNKIKGFIYSYLTKFQEIQEYQNQFPSSISDGVEKILKKIDPQINPYFEIARDLLIHAKRAYEKGVDLQNKQPSSKTLPMIIDHYYNGKIQLNNNILQNKTELELFEIIINYLVLNHEGDHLLNKNEVLMLFDYLNNLAENSSRLKENFAEDIKKLGDRVIGRNYTFNVKDIKSTVVQNLLVFLLKQDKLDELELILNENNIKNAYLSYCFLGITTGFSSLSRIVTQFAAHDMKLLEEIDKQVSRINKQIRKNNYYKNKSSNKLIDDDLYETELIPDSKIVDKEKEVEVMIIDRIQKIRESKVLKRLRTKKQIVLKNDVMALFEEIEGDMFIHFYKGDLDYLYVLLRSKYNSSTPEEQNNFRENLRKLGFEKGSISRIAQGNFPIFFYFKVNGNHDELLSEEDKEVLLDYLDFLIAK